MTITAGAQGLNCDDFQYQEDAQAVYDADPNDPHGLDGPPGPDNDTEGIPGRACERRPSRGTTSVPTQAPTTVPAQEPTTAPTQAAATMPALTPSTAPDSVQEPVTDPAPVQKPAAAPNPQVSACSRFDAWEWAQSVFDADPQANDALDPDGDGIACPGLPHGGFAPAFWTDRIPTDVEEAEIVRLIDGDTLEVLIDGVSNRVRIYRADTPETQKEQHCGGAEATAYAEWALSWNDAPGVVYLERDKNERDRYGRELAYVWFEVAGDPYLLNHVLINNGWADDVDYGDRKYDEQLKDAAAFADRYDLGVWSLCGGFGVALAIEPVTAPQPAEVPQLQAPEQPSSHEPPPPLATEPLSDQEILLPLATEVPLPPTEPPPPPTEPPPPPADIPVEPPPEEPTAKPT